MGVDVVGNTDYHVVGQERYQEFKEASDNFIDQVMLMTVYRGYRVHSACHPNMPRPQQESDAEKALREEIEQFKSVCILLPRHYSAITRLSVVGMEKKLCVV